MGDSNAFDLIPDKLYFKIGEVCDLTGIKAHTLRYWESEFKDIKPKRAGSNQRLYRKVDVETILQIKSLIYENGHTLLGAKKSLADKKGKINKTSRPKNACRDVIKRIKQDLISIKKSLEQ